MDNQYIVTDVGVAAFRLSNLISVKIGRLIERIGYRAFDRCYNLVKFEFEDNSNFQIDIGAFLYYTNVQKVTFPNTLKVIGPYFSENVSEIHYYGTHYITCEQDFTRDISIYVLNNFPSETFCGKPITRINEIPQIMIKSCYNYLFLADNINIFSIPFLYIK